MSVVEYEKDLHFTFRFRAAPVGSNRPTIRALDWSCRPGEYQYLIAFCTDEKILASGFKGQSWKNLLNRKPSRERKPTSLKWNPKNGTVLAVGCGCAQDGSSGTITELDLDSKDQCLKKVNKLMVPGGGGVSSLSWDSTGAYLLATVEPDQLHPQGYMVVLKYNTETRRSVKTIDCGYRTSFTATFHPSRSHILSTSPNSNEIIIWSEDRGSAKASFNWIKLFSITCSRGITKICFSLDGLYLAAIIGEGKGGRHVGGQVKIYSYSDEEEEGAVCCPVLQGVDIEEEDGVKRKKGVTLKYHCQKIISCDWSRDGEIMTGSATGSICIHGNNNSAQSDSNSRFNVIYLRFSDVNSVNASGSVTCVSWNPKLNTMIASAGVDGVVIIWQLLDKNVPLDYIRNYPREKNYFCPEREQLPAESAANMQDIKSASSIPVSESEEDDDGSAFRPHHDSASERGESEDSSTANSPEELADVERILLELEAKVDTNREALSALFSAIQRVTKKLLVMENELLFAQGFDTRLDSMDKVLVELPRKLEREMSGQGSASDVLDAVDQLKSNLQDMEGRILTKQNLLEENFQRRDDQLQCTLTRKLAEQEASIIEKQNMLSENVLSKLNQMDKAQQSILTRKFAEQEASIIEKQNMLSENVLFKLNQMDNTQLLRHQQMDNKVDGKFGKILEAIKGLMK